MKGQPLQLLDGSCEHSHRLSGLQAMLEHKFQEMRVLASRHDRPSLHHPSLDRSDSIQPPKDERLKHRSKCVRRSHRRICWHE